MKIIASLLLLIFSATFSYSQSESHTDELLAAQYFQNKEFSKALELYEKLFQSENSASFYQPYLTCLLELKDYSTSEKVIRKQIKRYPQDLTFCVDLGYLDKLIGEDKKGDKEFENAIKKIQPSFEQAIALSNSFLIRNEPDYAIKSLLQARKVFDGQQRFTMELADIYRKMNNPTEQLNIYMDALRNEPELTERIQAEMQNFIDGDINQQKSGIIKQAFLRQIQLHPDDMVYYEMMIWLAVQINDFNTAMIQSMALDRRYKEDGFRVFELASLALSNMDYKTSIECLKYVIAKGDNSSFYSKARISLAEVMYRRITESLSCSNSDMQELSNVYEGIIKDFGFNQSTALIIRDDAHLSAFYMHDLEKGLDLINKALEIYPLQNRTKAQCKIENADILLLSGDVWESSLLYSQVEKEFKNDPIGHEAKFRNAKLSFYRGEFKWAQAQLDVLKAATSKLIANDAMQLALLISDNIGEDTSMIALGIYSRADLLLYQNKYEEALIALDSIKNVSLSHPIFDEVLYKKAEIMIKLGKFDDAAKYLDQIVSTYSEDILGDDALFKLADITENQFKNKEKAMTLYQSLLEKYPGSIYVFDARKRFRVLRGDKVVN